jgi:thiol-disulfide isomerase/thioredoxin
MKKLFLTVILLLSFFLVVPKSCIAFDMPNKNLVRLEIEMNSDISYQPFLMIYENSFRTGSMQSDRVEIIPTSTHGNRYTFILTNQAKPMYFSLAYKREKDVVFILESYLYEPGDDIKIKIERPRPSSKFNVKFAGINSAKYKCASELPKAKEHLYNFLKMNAIMPSNGYDNTKFMIRKQLEIVEKYKPEMSAYITKLLIIDIHSKHLSLLLNQFRSSYLSVLKTKNLKMRNQLIEEYRRDYQFENLNDVTDTIYYESRYYPQFVMEKIQMDYLTKNNQPDYRHYYEILSNIRSQRLRDKMLVVLFATKADSFVDIYDELLQNALSIVKDKASHKKLKDFAAIGIGNNAFNFSLPDREGKIVNLSDFKDKVVFVDFWFTGCGACVSYFKRVLNQLEKNYEHVDDVVFITICIDRDKDKWLASIISGEYTSDKVINLYTNGEGNKHDVIKYYNIDGYPQPMIIDRKGRLFKYKGYDLSTLEKVTNELESARTIK